MVFFKRKPVQFLTNPAVDDDEKEVWLISETGEFFVDYEAYLNRMDFFKQRRFICQITGHSGLSFFEALKSELAGAQEVEEAFPEALKGPVLRRVQFQTISRIDTLVDLIFEEFRADYYPGEAVTVHVITGERLNGTVRDKTRFGSKTLPDGTLSAPFSRYFVSLENRPTEEAVVDDAHITRDRKIFTKQVLRSFIKKTVTREAWTGAPWLVRHDVAALYHIDTRVPPHLRYESKAAERKQNLQQKKAANPFHVPPDGFLDGHESSLDRSSELKAATKNHKSKQQQASKSKQQPFLNPAPSIPQFAHGPFVSHTFQAHGPPPPVGPHYANFHSSTIAFAPIAAVPQTSGPPPPPPIKYPIEDLQVPPRPNGPKRPPLKYFSQDSPMFTAPAEGNGILMKSVGQLLETWDALNVYCEIFKLDSFTFDDFVEAMQFTSEEATCELFVEAHCAALKLLVGSKAEGGEVHVRLPDLDEEEEEDLGEEATEPTPEPEPQPPARATRSSLAKAEAEALRQEEAREQEAENLHKHRAAEMQAEMDWVEHLKKRDFKSGGWEGIMVGLLYQLSKNPRLQKSCAELLEQLAPLGVEPTRETARQQYATLDVNLRIQALEIVCMLCAETKAMRGYMEECAELMTGYRKEKIVYQRDRKNLVEELRVLHEERKALLPEDTSSSPKPEQQDVNGDTNMHDTEEELRNSNGEETIDTDEDPRHGRSLRRGNDRAVERKRKREAEKVEKKKAEAEPKGPKQSKQLIKLMKDIQNKEEKVKECEEEIAVLDNDLREADCPRTRVLGKDRFWNRYYWFERNGMPYGGLPNSSTAEAGYANGCIWVQGPDDMEREGYIELNQEWQNEYLHKFNMTIPERKVMEEGTTHVFNAHQWGYFEDAESLEGLLAWLDPRGFNESKLKKDLLLYKDKIIEHMEKRMEYLNPTEVDKPVEINTKPRASTRKQQHQPQADQTVHRCLAWHNQMAVEEIGHLHSEEPRPRKAKKAAAAAVMTAPIVVEEPPQMKTRSEAKGKRGKGKEKSIGRQGTRCNF